ncbi:Uncharacterised protein [Achromobacter xylosoxidans]|nr:Uncharacterised protein [Achromobacter xylosoxidans]
MHRPQGGRKGGGVQVRQHLFGLLQASHQDQAAAGQVAGIGRIAQVAMALERGAGGIERRRGPAQVARGQRDLGLGHHAAGPRHRFPGAERAGGAPHQDAGAVEVAQLRQRDAAQRQARRVVAQRHPGQRAQRVAAGQRPRRGHDQPVHDDPAIVAVPPCHVHSWMPPIYHRAAGAGSWSAIAAGGRIARSIARLLGPVPIVGRGGVR